MTSLSRRKHQTIAPKTPPHRKAANNRRRLTLFSWRQFASLALCGVAAASSLFVASPTLADQPGSLGVIQDAKPIWRSRSNEETASQPSGQVQRIRWKPSRRTGASATISKPTTANPAAQPAGKQQVYLQPVDSPQASGSQNVSWRNRQGLTSTNNSQYDPFQNPFGDRVDPEIPPQANQASGQQPTQPNRPFDLGPGPGDPVDPAPPINPGPTLPPEPQTGPDPLQPTPGLDQSYDRAPTSNCDDQAAKCAKIRNYIRNDSIGRIALDITPRYRPDLDDLDEEAQRKSQQLAKAPLRSWRDRLGRSIGRGRLTNFENGRVKITLETGGTKIVPYNLLSEDDVCFVTAWWGLPMECYLGDDQFAGRHWTPSTFTFAASGMCHKPLYFEETQLERYGHTMGPVAQPLFSGAHFFVNVAVLPYKMGINPMNECQYALGHYRPGNCAPWLVPPIPISLRGGLYEAAFWTGAPLLIP